MDTLRNSKSIQGLLGTSLPTLKIYRYYIGTYIPLSYIIFPRWVVTNVMMPFLIYLLYEVYILVHIRTCLTISSKTWLMPIFGAVLLEKSVIWVYSILTFWLTHISYVHPFLWCGVSYFIKMIIRVYLTTTYQLVGSKHIFRNLQCNLCTTVCFRKEADFSK